MKFPVLNYTDGYKLDHRRQYPENTITVYSNFTPRKSRIAGINKVVVAGINFLIKDFIINEWNDTFFSRPKGVVIQQYKRRINNYLGPNSITLEHIEALHDLGYLPLRIKALPEGVRSPMGVPIMTITNELPEFFWLPNFLETVLSADLWPITTAATIAFHYRVILDYWAIKTTGSNAFSKTFQAHNFSARGGYGRHAPAYTDMGHAFCFTGSDTVWGIDALEEFYNADSDTELVMGSVPATEHSVMCMGTKEAEIDTFRRLITKLYPSGIVSVVADTWDLWSVVKRGGICEQLKEEILARDGKLVIRPDSGNPADILCGLKGKKGTWSKEVDGKFYHSRNGFHGKLEQYEVSEAEYRGVVESLWMIFGGITTDQGYKVLDSHIGTIYGDSITLDRAEEICSRLADKGFASTNVVFGIGSYTYQYVTRDTFGFAMKATYGELSVPISIVEREGEFYITVEGQPEELMEGLSDEAKQDVRDNIPNFEEGTMYGIEVREIFKDPITDDGTKRSAKGLLVVYKDENGDYYLKDQVTSEEEEGGELLTVYEHGELTRDAVLKDIRAIIDEEVAKEVALRLAA